MPETLIVLAHPEPRSFTAEWARCSARLSEALGHRVLWSDLYAMGFDPAEKPQHYGGFDQDARFDPLAAQDRAAKSNALPADVSGEIDKIRRADRILFHFPLWWFGPPAILKGWFDRVLVHGALHSSTRRFDRGLCSGKHALFCVSAGSSEEESAPSGREGDVTMLLWPLAYALRYLGFHVAQPVTVHGVHGFHKPAAQRQLEAKLAAALKAHSETIENLEDQPRIAFNADGDFDARGRLRSGAPSHSPFIRHNR